MFATVAKRKFGSENVQNTCVSAHFLNLTCRKIRQLASSSVNHEISQVVN